jgi:hypothetical protein
MNVPLQQRPIFSGLLSAKEGTGTGAIVLAAYLGLGCEADGFSDMKAVLRAYYLDPAKRAMLVGVVAER